MTFGFAIDADARRRLPRIVAAAAGMGAVLWLVLPSLPLVSGNSHGLGYPALVLTLILAGIGIYGLFLTLLGVIGWREAVNAFRQTAKPRLRD